MYWPGKESHQFHSLRLRQCLTNINTNNLKFMSSNNSRSIMSSSSNSNILSFLNSAKLVFLFNSSNNSFLKGLFSNSSGPSNSNPKDLQIYIQLYFNLSPTWLQLVHLSLHLCCRP